MSKDGKLFERYKGGEHEAVWSELRSHESIDGEYREEALAVANETMKRVAHNVDLIAERLAKLGWEPRGGHFRRHPSAGDDAILAKIEKRTNSQVPASLKAFWQVVGGVNLAWNYGLPKRPPSLGVDLPMIEMDPLVVYPLKIMEPHLFDQWDEQDFPEEGEEEYFTVNLAPDFYHKADISGGAPYSVILPWEDADPILQDEEHNLPFTDYLRLCFKFGGFSKLDEHAERPDVKAFVKQMTAGLEPF